MTDQPAPAVEVFAHSRWPTACLAAAVTGSIAGGVANWFGATAVAEALWLLSSACFALFALAGLARWLSLQEPLLECSDCYRLRDASALTAVSADRRLCDECLAPTPSVCDWPAVDVK